ncbi:MAG: glycosyltransferase family 9 protein [Melioribacteraceae bacterium]
MKNIEIILRKVLLKIFLFFSKNHNTNGIPDISNKKVLIIRLNRIGDALVTTPLITSLKNNFNPMIYLLADKKNHFVFKNNNAIEEVIIFDKKKGLRETIEYLNKMDFDIIIDTHTDVSTTVSLLIAYLSAPIKIGFNKENRKIYTHLVPILNTKVFHVIDRLLEITNYLLNYKSTLEKYNIDYSISKDALIHAETFINEHKDKFILGINISAGSDARFWGIENYKRLILALDYDNIQLIILCALSDIEKAESISENNIPIYYSESFEIFSAIITKLDILITPDTSIVHIASAFKVPVFGLYVQYDTEDTIWYPYSSDYEIVLTKEATLKNISFNEVKTKLIPFIEKYHEK